MDIQVYNNIKSSLKKYFDKLKLSKTYNPSIVGFEPSTPTYPMVKFQEPRNVPVVGHDHPLQTIANLGYKFDIYAKTTGSVTKQEIARQLAFYCNEFATKYVNLRQVSWNEFENDGVNGSLYHIVITYSGNYFENKLKFI